MSTGGRILLIDDDPALLAALRETLRWKLPDAIVDGLSSADAASALLQREHYDLVISDVRMPGQDGLAFLDSISSLPSRPPVILITGAVEETIAREATRRGARAVVSKPLDRSAFIAMVRAVLDEAGGPPSAEQPTG